MNDPLKYPKLRWPLEVRLEDLVDRKVLIIRCPLGLCDEPLGLVPVVAPLLHQFDGNHSVEDIVQRFAHHGATIELLEQLVSLLDDNFFLDSPKFHQHEKKIRQSFSDAEVREASLAGLGYSNSEALLAEEVDRYLLKGTNLEIPLKGGMMGLVAPHIDYNRGGEAYGITYSSFRSEHHDLYVLIGTSHQYSQHMFHLTAKDFASPFGLAQCDKTFMNELATHYGNERSFADEFLHKQEHSLELQVPFLLRMKEKASIAPILVGGFHHMLQSDKPPQQFEEYNRFAEALSETLKKRIDAGESICFLAGVDMAHVGQSFGDQTTLTPEFMEEVAERDQIYLQSIEQQDKDMLFSHIAEDGDARRICGFPTMYTILDVCDRLGIQYSAQVFDYQQAVNYESECAVTFAGVGMYYQASSDTLTS